MSNNRLIFIVDDDEMYSEMLLTHLSPNPRNTIIKYATGEDCLKNIYNDPDIVILDYYLNMVHKDAANGMQILQQIKKNNSNIKVIMLSSQEQYGVALRTISKGAEQYVVKDEGAFKNIDAIIKELD
jgi:DNA-binding NarL/FixJ family response regulator